MTKNKKIDLKNRKRFLTKKQKEILTPAAISHHRKSLVAQRGLDFGQSAVGAVGGWYLGTVMGQHSLWAGTLMMLAGSWFDLKGLTAMGAASVASGVVKDNTVNGIDLDQSEPKTIQEKARKVVQSVKNRSGSFAQQMKQKLFLHKLKSFQVNPEDPATLQGVEDVALMVMQEEINRMQASALAFEDQAPFQIPQNTSQTRMADGLSSHSSQTDLFDRM